MILIYIQDGSLEVPVLSIAKQKAPCRSNGGGFVFYAPNFCLKSNNLGPFVLIGARMRTMSFYILIKEMSSAGM